ncbi:MAG: tRNA 4-thiouridine(8) synthase ThiI [Chloroflexia bacterium]
MTKPFVQGIGLFSGGLDSLLSLYLLLEQGLKVEAMHAVLPVHRPGLRAWVEQAAARLGVPLYLITLEEEFFEILRHPRHGYGSGMNPCLDCHILLLRRAAERMRAVGASFVFTGEVLGERPMSQHLSALQLVERKSGLQGRLLRPLSARLLPPTIPEEEGLVDRSRLLDIRGRSRRVQLELARRYGLSDFPTPAGGCMLTDPGLSRRVRDLLQHRPNFSRSDFDLLRVGRHFRLSPEVKAVSGRNREENARLLELVEEGDLLLEVRGMGSPITLLRGPADEGVLRLAAAITARYSDARTSPVRVHYGARYPELEGSQEVEPAAEELLTRLRI